MKKKISLFLLFLFLTGCAPRSSSGLSKDEKLVNSVLYHVAKKLKKEKDLFPAGSGGGMMNKVTLLRLMFDYYKPLEISDGRKLIIDAATELVAQINAKEELRQYLYRYPFQIQDVEIFIFLHNPDGSTISDDRIKHVVLSRGLVKFETNDPGHPFTLTIHHETIEEALSRIANPPAESLELKPLPRVELPKPGDKNLHIGFCG